MADDDDFDEDSIPAFSRPTLSGAESPVPQNTKGKNRAPEQLAPPGQGGSNRPSSPRLSGNIGSNAAPSNARRTIGGVRVETRYACVHRTYSTH